MLVAKRARSQGVQDGAAAIVIFQFIIHVDRHAISENVAFFRLAQPVQFDYTTSLPSTARK